MLAKAYAGWLYDMGIPFGSVAYSAADCGESQEFLINDPSSELSDFFDKMICETGAAGKTRNADEPGAKRRTGGL